MNNAPPVTSASVNTIAWIFAALDQFTIDLVAYLEERRLW